MFDTAQIPLSPMATSQPAAANGFDRHEPLFLRDSGDGIVAGSFASCGAVVEDPTGATGRVSVVPVDSGAMADSTSGADGGVTGIDGCACAAAAFSRATRAAGCWESFVVESPSGRHDIDHFPFFIPAGLSGGTVSRTCSTRLASSSCSCSGGVKCSSSTPEALSGWMRSSVTEDSGRRGVLAVRMRLPSG
jgi:hypothetical protein